MNKEFIPYEQALELKELGFYEECLGYYFTTNGKNWEFAIKYDFDIMNQTLDIGNKFILKAPLYQQAFRWFREKYNISYSIDWMSRNSESYSGYIVHFRGINGNKINNENFIVLNDELPPLGYGVYKTYEEAELACLKKLIELVKNK
jgi:hypothetical protein